MNKTDHSQRAYTLPGGGAVIIEGGRYTLTGGTPSAVGIADLTHVENHTIARIAGSTAHHVHFFGGGELYYVFNTRGEIVELWASKLQTTLTPQRQLIFAPLRTTAA